MRQVMLAVLVAAVLVGGCSPKSPNLFSGKPVVEFDQAQFFVTYIKVAKVYVILKLQVVQACAAKALTPAACEQFDQADQAIQKIDGEILTALQNPAYPLDMAKVQTFVDLVLVTLVRVGVKGITGGIAP